MSYPKLIEEVIIQFSKLPGVGRRSAERMAFWVLNHPVEDAQKLTRSIIDLKENLKFCRSCHHLSDTEICPICSDSTRDQTTICVVENPKDLIAIERSGIYKGQYHVLLGTIAPSEGRGPDELTMAHLINRVETQNVKEVVIATDPDNEGEMTALYIIKQLQSKDVKVTRIGLGIPMGSSVEFSDISTLAMSLKSRRVVTENI